MVAEHEKWTIYSSHPAEKQHPPDPECGNCDGRGCMACVLRKVHERCKNDCPECCSDNYESIPVEVVRASRLEAERQRAERAEEALQEAFVRLNDPQRSHPVARSSAKLVIRAALQPPNAGAGEQHPTVLIQTSPGRSGPYVLSGHGARVKDIVDLVRAGNSLQTAAREHGLTAEEVGVLCDLAAALRPRQDEEERLAELPWYDPEHPLNAPGGEAPKDADRVFDLTGREVTGCRYCEAIQMRDWETAGQEDCTCEAEHEGNP